MAPLVTKPYIIYKSFKKHNGKTYPTGTKCFLVGGAIYAFEDKQFLCMLHSQHARTTIICSNADGQGLIRGRLIDDICMLIWGCENAQWRMPRVEALFLDPVAKQFDSGSESWIFNDLIYEASIEDLKHIYELCRNTTPDNVWGSSILTK